MRALWAVVLSCVGCAGLQPRLVDASVQKPSNVAVYFTVDTRGGEPVPGLTAEQFHIYEDDKLVSPYESKQTILNPEVAAKHYTLLLVDMSGSVTKSGGLPALQEAVNAFTSRVAQYQETAVYAFDGRNDIFQLRNFAPGAANVNLSSFSTQDPSTNLNGAAIKAMELLDKHLEKSPVPLRFGTLVVFTDGTDHAARATHEQLMGWVRAVPFDLFVIGVGAEISEPELHELGRSGTALSRDPSTVGQQFDAIATRIEGYSKRFYLLSYCSPARAGDHLLKVQPFLSDGRTGEVTYPFNANGFGPNCDPNRKPAFDIKKPRAAVQAP
ncbi:MAG: VWA domain-containing protein [Archangiaceae bacterium]|nr:VWA domain-containing protein [Archangiaceae bacterium]